MASMELKDFIHKVRDEIRDAYDERPDEPILALTAIELEVSFTLSGKGGAKGKLLVVDLEGEVSSERTHKVTIHLVPNAPAENSLSKSIDKAAREIAKLPIAGISKDQW